MRAAIQPHLSTSPDAARLTLLRSTLLRAVLAMLVTLALVVVWRPTVVHAQKAPMKAPASAPAAAVDTSSSSHVVRAGESLWSVADRFYGDGHKWQELATRNGISLSQDKPLLVGMKLRVPARHGIVTNAAAPSADPSVPKVALVTATPPSNAPAVAVSTESLAAQTSGKADAVATRIASSARASTATGPRRAPRKGAPLPKIRRTDANSTTTTASNDTARMEPPSRGRLGIGSSDSTLTPVVAHMGLVSQADMRAARDNADVATVFLRHVPDAAETEAQERAAAYKKAPAPRRGEYEAAPFVIRDGRLAQGGRIVRRIGAASPGSLGGITRVLIADEVEISAPVAAHLTIGDRLVSINAERLLSKDARVAVPSGILVVIRADAGKPIIASIHSQSGVIEIGQLLFAIEGAAPTVAQRAEPTATSDVDTKVLWVDDVALIPTLQSYILLSAGSTQGVKAGDQFALVQHVGTGAAAREERIAVARVVRSGPEGSSAIIVRQERADIAVGGAARRVARVP